MLTFILMLLALAIGMITPVQAGINAHLGKYINNNFHAAFISFLGGILTVSLASICTNNFFPKTDVLFKAPPLLFIGGTLGAIFVLVSIIIAPKLGAGVFICSVVAGQLIASVILDHFGWLGFSPHPINALRILGICLLFMGMTLIKFF